MTDDRRTVERLAGYVRYGVFLGYAQDLFPSRGFWVCDEIKLFQRGRLKIVAAEVVRLLAVPTPDGTQRLVYSFLAASATARERAMKAVRASLPKFKEAQDGGSGKRPRDSGVVACVPETLLALTELNEDEDHEEFLDLHALAGFTSQSGADPDRQFASSYPSRSLARFTPPGVAPCCELPKVCRLRPDPRCHHWRVPGRGSRDERPATDETMRPTVDPTALPVDTGDIIDHTAASIRLEARVTSPRPAVDADGARRDPAR